MPDFIETEVAAYFSNYVVRGPFGGFIDEEDCIEGVGLSVTAAHVSGLSCSRSSSLRMVRMLSPSSRDSSR